MTSNDTFADDRLIKFKELSALLGLTRNTIKKLIHSGEISPIRIGGVTRYSNNQIQQWIRSKSHS